jgi:glycosyltransferase involved in cell wall biosynthesis
MIKPIHFFTICARNYLAMAAALNESLAVHHPESKFTVFVLDYGDIPDYVTSLALRPIEEVIPNDEYARRCCYYEMIELATSVKARCFQKLFSDGEQIVVYLDPDIYLFKALKEVESAIRGGSSGVLIPHILSSLPEDGAHPDDLDILRSGVYNLGFLALAAGPNTNKFLQWWERKLEYLCLRDPREGVFVDQKWMNFAPLFLHGLCILRDQTYNVAYWNLSQRVLERAEGKEWRVNGSPLTFFHFSGFDPARKHALSTHEDRVRTAQGPLADLLSFYASRLYEHRHEELVRIVVPRIKFETGAAWDSICRVLYRWKVKSGDNELNPLRDASFLSWMGSFGPGQSVPRYIQVLFQMRPDVAAAYPHVPGRDWDRLLDWLTNSGVREFGIDRPLLVELGIIRPTVIEVPRVTYVGYLRSHLGLGEAARGYVQALASQGVPLSLVDISRESLSAEGNYSFVDSLGTGGLARDSDVEVIHVNADQFTLMLHKYSSKLTAHHRVAIWAWETNNFPDHWKNNLDTLDEVWVGSQFMAEAIGTKARCPVLVIPHVVKVPPAKLGRPALGLSEEDFLFLMQFDILSATYRKNPEATIRAFKMAFPNREPVKLLIKTMNGGDKPEEFEQLKELADDPRIVFWDESLDSERRYELLAAVDCYVSLHRAEGFGLSLAESMAYGKPVIATGWSGNLEFMNVSNSILIPYSLEPLKYDVGPYNAGTVWAEVDQEAAAAAMHRVYFDRGWAETIGARAKKDIANNLSPEVIGKMMKARLELLASTSLNVPIRGMHRRRIALFIQLKQFAAGILLFVRILRNPSKFRSKARKAQAYYRKTSLASLVRKIFYETFRSNKL